MRLKQTSVSLLQEDPRYFRVENDPFKARVGNVVRLTFMARMNEGSYGPAYARYLAIAGGNFLSNTWRAPSESNTSDALLRTAEGFAGRMVINAFEEFWPDVKSQIFSINVTDNGPRSLGSATVSLSVCRMAIPAP